jgi:hypothetical protein
VEAREIIRKAVAADERNWQIARSYAFLERVELRRLDSQGRVKLSEVQTYDVTLQAGTPYRQLVQRDDRPLIATEEKKERESLAKSIAERRQETTAERARRLFAYQSRPDWQREAWNELPDAFEFRLFGDGCWMAAASSSSRQRRARDTRPDPAPPRCFTLSKADSGWTNKTAR